MAAAKAVPSRLRVARTSKRSPAATRNFLERLPSEILMKILSYLDASALFSLSFVSKLFNRLSNDNTLWIKIYIAEFGRNKKQKPKGMDELLLKTDTLELQDRAVGYWKWLHFRTLASCDMNKWKRQLRLISCHTGLPSQTEQILRNLHVTWELTVSEKSGQVDTHEPSCSHFGETFVTLCWSGGGRLPSYLQISTLQLHGIRRVALNCPGLKKPGWRSFMAKMDIQALTKSAQVIGQDRLVELRLIQPGIIIGVWKDQLSVAFIMFTLHYHKLVERSILGSSLCPYVEPTFKPPFDDIDPEYGLHDYQLHIVLHNTECEIMSGSFPKLFCRRSHISEGLIQLSAICRTELLQHLPLSGSITLPWRCEALQGAVENCCIMSLTLLDEFKKPFWCVSSPVFLKLQKKPHMSYDYDGEHFLIHYQDSDGQVKMELVWMEKQKRFFLISLVVFVTVCKVNEYFSKDY